MVERDGHQLTPDVGDRPAVTPRLRVAAGDEMFTKVLLGAAVLIAVLGASGCAATAGTASRPAYLDTMCPLHEQVDAFFEAQEAGGLAETIRAAGPVSVAELAAADALDGYRWDPSIASHIPAISASLRATSAMWADVAQGDMSPETPGAGVLEADQAARDAVEATLKIEFPQACNHR
jgi:hypothetical protein